MRINLLITASVTFVAAAVLVGQLFASAHLTGQAIAPGDSTWTATPIAGPDVICGDVNGVQNWGGSGGLSVYSLGTTSCNIGTAQLLWQQFTTQHPVMPQNIYRIETVEGASRIEQIGMSWLKHGFCALQQTLCGACTPAGGGCASALGVGCSDPYTSARNGTQSNMGPRYDINASTGVFTYPLSYIGATTGIGLKGKRIQVSNTDLNPSLHPGAEYWGECQYVHPQDAGADNNDNNASRRKLNVGPLSGTAPNQFYQLSMSGPTVQMECALFAWKASDASVTIVNVDVPDDGRFVAAYDVTETSPGIWHYEYAIYNLNSHRSGEKFSVPIPDGVIVTGIEFHDIDYHTQQLLPSQFQVDNIDWSATIADAPGIGSAITWSTSAYTAGSEHTANALRWGTTFNFRFDASTGPTAVQAMIDLFRPGRPETVSFTVLGPSVPVSGCKGDLTGGGVVNGLDLAFLLGAWGPCLGCAADLDASGSVDEIDISILLGLWGPC